MEQTFLVCLSILLINYSSTHSSINPFSSSQKHAVPTTTTTTPLPSRYPPLTSSVTLPWSALVEPWQRYATSPFRVKSPRGRSTDFGKEAFFLRYHLEEEQPPGTFVGNVALDCQGEQNDAPSMFSETEESRVGNALRDESYFDFVYGELLSKLSGSQVGRMERSASGTNSGGVVSSSSSSGTASARYRFVSDSITLFHLDQQTGVMTTRKVIDRDSPDFCRQKPTCEVHVSVVVQNGRQLRIVKVIVDITDINDNPPR